MTTRRRRARSIDGMRTLGAILAVVGLAACSSSPAPDATGAEVYELSCARCHAADLSGGFGPALGARSELAQKPDAYLVQAIVQGIGSRMPAFGSSLTDQHVDRLVSFIREQQGQ